MSIDEKLLGKIKEYRENIASVDLKSQQIEEIFNDLQTAKKEEEGLKNPSYIIGAWVGRIIIIAMIFFTIICLTDRISFFAIIIGCGAGLLVGGSIAKIVDMIVRETNKDLLEKKIKDCNETANKFHEESVVPLEEKLKAEQNSLEEFLCKDSMIEFKREVPEKYQSVDAFDYFVKYIEECRADSKKELFNLYEEELHKREMKEIAQEQLKSSINQEKLLSNIEKRQKHISRQVKLGNIVNSADAIANHNFRKKMKNL